MGERERAEGARDPATPAVPDAVAPPPRHPRFPLLDGMRAIAVLAVVLVHVTVFSGPGDSIPDRLLLHLNIGVTIFFLISGFLLYRPFIAHRAGGAAAPPVGSYAKRRFLRIFPAYWLILLILWVTPGVSGTAGGGWLAHVGLVQTLPGAGQATSCVVAISECGLAQTWSLVVEATFYVLLPLYAFAAAGLAAGRRPAVWVRRELGLLAGLSVASVIGNFVIVGNSSTALSASVLGYAFWFALGMSLAIVSVAGNDAGAPVRRAVAAVSRHSDAIWIAAAILYLVLVLLLPATPFLVDRGDQILGHVGFGLVALLALLPAVFGDGRSGLAERLLARPLVAWLGLISYGIFLWHYVFAIELGSPGEGLAFLPLLALTLLATVPIAAASYYLVERPLLRLKYVRVRFPLSRR